MNPYTRYTTTRMADHFSIFVYPFEHGLIFKEQEDFFTRVWEEGWRPWVCRLKNESELKELRDTLRYHFHPPILKTLYPEIHKLTHCEQYYWHVCPELCEDEKTSEPHLHQKLLSQLYRASQTKSGQICMDYFWTNLQPDETVRLTFDFRHQKKQPRKYYFPVSDGTDKVLFRIEWIDAYLFPFQSGFLCIKLVLYDDSGKSRKETHADRLMLFHRSFRNINSEIKKELLAQWLFPLKSGKKNRESETFPLEDYMTRFKLFSFISLTNDYGSFEPRAEPDEFCYGIDRYYRGIDRFDGLLYEMASVCEPTTLISNDKKGMQGQPSHKYLKEDVLGEHKIYMWKYWRGIALKNTTVFISLGDKGQPDASRYEKKYFPLYIYTLNLKIRLFRFSRQLSLKHLKDNPQKILKVLKDFLLFRNEYWKNEVSPNFQMGILFKKFKYGLTVDEDYESICTEADSLFKYQQSLFSRRIGKLLLVLFIAAIIIGLFNIF